jgi:hypothetical protein
MTPSAHASDSGHLAPGAVFTASYDAHGVLFTYPSTMRSAEVAAGTKLVPAGATWLAIFRGHSSEQIAVASYPASDPGTPAGRAGATTEVGDQVARLLSLSPPLTVDPMRAAAGPAFRYVLNGGASAPRVYVLFTTHTRYVIGCAMRTPALTAEFCDTILTSFRITRAGLRAGMPSIQSVATTVYSAWQSGDLSGTRSLATARVREDLGHSPWDDQSPPGACLPSIGGLQDTDVFDCNVLKSGKPDMDFQLRLVHGRWMVASIGECDAENCYFILG